MNRPRPFRYARVALTPALLLTFGLAGAAAQTAPDKDPAATTPPPAAASPAPPSAAPPAAPSTPASPPASSTPAPPAEAPAASPPAAQAPAPAVPAPAQSADAFGEEITLAPKQVVVLKGKANWDNAFDALMDAFKALTAVLDKQGIKPNGNPMIVYTSTDDAGFTFQAQIPVPETPKTLGKNISMGQSPDGKALKFLHRGSYDNMDNTYEAITNFLDDKKLEAKDTFIEEYLADPLKTAEDKLVINVYVPLK